MLQANQVHLTYSVDPLHCHYKLYDSIQHAVSRLIWQPRSEKINN